MARQEYLALDRGGPPDDTDPLSIELVHAGPVATRAVAASVAAALEDAPHSVEPAFGTGEDRYFFVDFPDVDPRGQERAVFAFARALREAVGADEANPVLTDSLYGAAAVGTVTESLLSMCETPRDSTLPFGWHHPQIDTIGAWVHTRGEGVTVAVIDTGYSSHNELRDLRTAQGEINLVEGGTNAEDRFSTGFMKHPGHGTLVMSVIASRGTADGAGNTGTPGAVTGTAPAARIMPIRAIRSVIDATQRRIGQAVVHATENGADVISMALGGPSRVAATEAALRTAVNAGVVVTCAAGNCWPFVVFPAAYAPLGLCTAIAALQPDRQPWAKTGSGPAVTFSAFGEQVWGAAKNKAADPDNGIRASQGTTLATSMTAGVAALWVARHGGRQALLAKAQALGTTVQAMWVHAATHGMTPPPAWGNRKDLGAGVLDARAALDAALPGAAEAPPRPRGAAEPTLNILQMHLTATRPDAAAELTPAMAELAPEMIWLSYRAGAKRRVLDTRAEAPVAVDTPTEALSRAVRDKPALRAALGA